MIAETSAFLTWALSSGVELPRIPTRRVRDGGFSGLWRESGARAAMVRWWWRAIDHVEQYRD